MIWSKASEPVTSTCRSAATDKVGRVTVPLLEAGSAMGKGSAEAGAAPDIAR
jgi:hypothetical protein